ncbi:Isocitrate lyase family [Musa troglodytarum]|uniref:Isocitrate lyase family n=1 Tax=Musa troglodytarum TaxID=320322 RepID=A0A9E7I8R7_9LILI|nr:Isocitrate lyase family [Musa troglodytarum]URE43491.1 Isocitrate lyase family [Musa troglodytarum]
MNVRRTVKCCIQSGFAGIIPEDQASPKLAVILVEGGFWRGSGTCIKATIGVWRKIGCDIMIAGMLEGGERTPILNPVELEIGSMLVSYPLSLIGYQSQHWRLEWSKYYKRQKHWKPSLRLQQ